MHDMTVNWPNGARCAVMLSFDFDAETLWLARDPANINRPGILSQGRYGAKVGVPKILDTLREEQVKGTFFVPGWTAEKHPSRVEMMLSDGHEVGHHSYSHKWVGDDTSAEIEEMEKGLEALARFGVKPKGYRSPAGEVSPTLFSLLKKYDFAYDSSLMDDVNPYRHRLEDGTPGVVELPWHWSLDDVPQALFSVKHPRPIFPNEHILKIFKQEFNEIYKWGGLFVAMFHPQVTGRPGRLSMLRELIAYICQFPDVWFATGEEIAQAWSEVESACATPLNHY